MEDDTQKDTLVGQASSLLVGKEVFPGYCLRQLRGRGGFGTVWEAETSEGRVVALKFLPCGDSRSASQEVRAIQFIQQLCHPNLIQIDQVWCHHGYVVLTMPLADGSLLDLLDAYQNEFGTPLAAVDLCHYLSQVARVLDFLNGRRHMDRDGKRVGIQHCDVKPTNLLLFGETVKICDFGLSSTTSASLKFHRRAGTLDYAAPEIFQGRLTDWTDQFSLAVTYFHLRTGKLPFPSVPRAFTSTFSRPTPDLNLLPTKERPLIARALAHVPQDRWPSSSELMAELSRVAR